MFVRVAFMQMYRCQRSVNEREASLEYEKPCREECDLQHAK